MGRACTACTTALLDDESVCPGCGRAVPPRSRRQQQVVGVVLGLVMLTLFVTLAIAGQKLEASWVEGWTAVGGARVAAGKCVPGGAWTPEFKGAALVGGSGLVALRLEQRDSGATAATLATRPSAGAAWSEVPLTPARCPALSVRLRHAAPWHGGRRSARRYSGQAAFSCTLPDGRPANGNLKFGDCR